MYALWSLLSEHRTSSLPRFRPRFRMKVPYLLDLYMCNTTRTFPSFQPQLTPRPPPKLAPEPSSATSVVRVTRSAAQPQCITAYGMIGRPSLAARCPHRRCGPLSLHNHEDQSRLQAHPGPLCNETERRGGFGTWLSNLSTHAQRSQVRGRCPPQSILDPRLAFVRLREGAKRRLNFPIVGPPFSDQGDHRGSLG
ncbi:hypothetical protein CABS03_05143 [Colletotrichum abscissum]|uniref:Uncharacterized protein n=1 Tax=Colletotrichum abscissum TaxID=1671311 RepID=A0A9Q0B8I2_9PEZI|nr:hypothetical protein CABS02_00375 [Colletotrichum abscissum]